MLSLDVGWGWREGGSICALSVAMFYDDDGKGGGVDTHE